MPFAKQISLRLLLLVTTFLAVCFAILGAYLALQRSSLAGLVTVNGVPLGSAKITLVSSTNPDQNGGATSVTNSDGEYAFSQFLSPGDYIARVEYLGTELPTEIPAHYNETSELEFRLNIGDNQYDLDLYLPTVKQGAFSTEP